MTEENLELLYKRLSSLTWRMGWMVLLMAVDFTLENLGLLSLSGEWIILIGLILGEVSKYINNKLTR